MPPPPQSPQLVEVRFKGNRKAFFEWHEPEPLRHAEPVIVESARGLDFGVVSATGAVAQRKCDRCTACAVGGEAEGDHARREPEPTRRVVRRATRTDRRAMEDLRRQEDDVRRKVREKARGHGLAMKVSDAEWQWDRNRLTVYFTADKRVDFRALVRDLAATFRTRIELRQIGVRDEAARLSGIGRCGRELCSASWLPELRPIGLSIAKDQRLSLNPSQISGPCGRLLCCLRYEHEFYVQSRKRFPKEGKVLRTAKGLEKVLSIDIFRERVTVRAEDGATRIVPLADLKAELEQAAGAAAAAGPSGPAVAEAGLQPVDAERALRTGPSGPASAERGLQPVESERGRRPVERERGRRPVEPERERRPVESERGLRTGPSGPAVAERGLQPVESERGRRPVESEHGRGPVDDATTDRPSPQSPSSEERPGGKRRRGRRGGRRRKRGGGGGAGGGGGSGGSPSGGRGGDAPPGAPA